MRVARGRGKGGTSKQTKREGAVAACKAARFKLPNTPGKWVFEVITPVSFSTKNGNEFENYMGMGEVLASALRVTVQEVRLEQGEGVMQIHSQGHWARCRGKVFVTREGKEKEGQRGRINMFSVPRVIRSRFFYHHSVTSCIASETASAAAPWVLCGTLDAISNPKA
jgi:hypothetical protein